MKLVSRDFRTGEKVLIAFLALVLLGLAYYWLVDKPVREGIEEAHAQRDAIQTDLTVAQAKLMQLQQMQDELDNLGSLDLSSRMGSYNNSKEELTELNRILSSASSYTVNFSNVTRSGDQIRRNFTLSFTASSYNAAKNIIRELRDCPLRCVLGNISYSGGGQNAVTLYGERVNNRDTRISISTNATFFETMYDGVPDAGLPS